MIGSRDCCNAQRANERQWHGAGLGGRGGNGMPLGQNRAKCHCVEVRHIRLELCTEDGH